jgi:NitT/TauT family transport system permease protein
MVAAIDRLLPRAAVSDRRRWPRVGLFLVVLLAVWELAAALILASGDRLAQSKVPFPHLVAAELVAQWDTIATAAWATARGAGVGLLVGAVVGLAIGLLMAQTRLIERAVYPYVVAAQMIPTIALAPIILGAVRNPDATRIIVAAYVTVFAVSLGTIKGLKSTPRDGLELLRTYNSSRWTQYVKLRIPAALPHVFSGLRVAAPLAVVGEIVVELAGSKDGLGTLLLTSQYYGPAYAYLFWASLVATMLLGLAFAAAAVVLERVVTPWQPEFRRGR